MRAVAALLLALAGSACGSTPCLKRCAPPTQIEVVTTDGTKVLAFHGSASVGGETFVVDCDGASNRDEGDPLVATCNGNVFQFHATGRDIALDLTSNGLRFNGVLTTTFEPDQTEADSCSGGCGRNFGQVVLR